MRRSILPFLLTVSSLTIVVAFAAAALQVTPKRPVIDHYGKVEVKGPLPEGNDFSGLFSR